MGQKILVRLLGVKISKQTMAKKYCSLCSVISVLRLKNLGAGQNSSE